MTANVPPPMTPRGPGVAPAGNTALLVVAISLGLVCVLVTNLYVARVRRAVQENVQIIYITTASLQAGQKIRFGKDTVEMKIPANLQNALPVQPLSAEAIKNNQSIPIARSARQGEIVSYDLYKDSGKAIEQAVPRGDRAIFLPINSRNSPGLLRPGMYIDILATFRPPGKLPQVLTVMEAVKVIAVGLATEEGNTGPTRSFAGVTVAVKPRDAEVLLSVAKHVGREPFDVLVRNPGDIQGAFTGVNPEAKRLVGIEE